MTHSPVAAGPFETLLENENETFFGFSLSIDKQISRLCMMWQGELEDERRARKQQGERADLAHKALGDKQEQLDLASQRITAADAASDEGKSQIQVMLLMFDISLCLVPALAA